MITIELRDNEADHLYELIKSFLNGELISNDDDECELPVIYTKPYRTSYDMICNVLEPFVFAERNHNEPEFNDFDWEEVDDEENLVYPDEWDDDEWGSI